METMGEKIQMEEFQRIHNEGRSPRELHLGLWHLIFLTALQSNWGPHCAAEQTEALGDPTLPSHMLVKAEIQHLNPGGILPNHPRVSECLNGTIPV